jgi:hypothetical protein
MKIILENTNIVSGRFTGVAKVVDGDTVLENYPVSARTRAELDNTLRNLLAIHQALPAQFADLADGEYTVGEEVEEVTETVEPTPEELLAQAIASKEAEIQAEVERIKKEREIAEIAAEHSNVAAKLAELEVLRNKK